MLRFPFPRPHISLAEEYAGSFLSLLRAHVPDTLSSTISVFAMSDDGKESKYINEYAHDNEKHTDLNLNSNVSAKSVLHTVYLIQS